MEVYHTPLAVYWYFMKIGLDLHGLHGVGVVGRDGDVWCYSAVNLVCWTMEVRNVISYPKRA